MGLPASYPDLPSFLLHLLFLLAHLRTLINFLLRSLGLNCLLHPEPQDNHLHQKAPLLLEETSPTIRFADLPGRRQCSPESCAVCLREYAPADELRPMRNCSHVFHRRCVDRWVEHGRSTCPMCRAPLVSCPTINVNFRL